VFAAASLAAEVSGRVAIAKGLHGKAKPTAVLYIIARPTGAVGGPPLAVKRFPQPFGNEVRFTFSPSDTMFPEMKFEGKITLTARVAQAGSATPVMAGDLEVSKSVETEVGKGTPVRLVIDKIH